MGLAAGDMDTYRFVGNSPTDETDPLGLWPGWLDRFERWMDRNVGDPLGRLYNSNAPFRGAVNGTGAMASTVADVPFIIQDAVMLPTGRPVQSATGRALVAARDRGDNLGAARIVMSYSPAGFLLWAESSTEQGIKTWQLYQATGDPTAFQEFAGSFIAQSAALPIAARLFPAQQGSQELANCFPPDTLVGTEAGLRPIGQVNAGERVWAYDFARGFWRLCEVECRHDSSYNGPLVTLDLGVGEVTATAYHPFWVIEGQDLDARSALRDVHINEDRGLSLPGRWVNSHDLREGDVILLRNYGRTTIRRVWQHHEQTMVCNLTIQDLHTFAVGEHQVLVHNTSGSMNPLSPKPGGTTPPGEMAALLYELSQMSKSGFTPTEIEIALQQRIAQLDALAQLPENNWGRVVAEPYPNQVEGSWRVYQGQPGKNGIRPIMAIDGQTGQVLVGTTKNIRPLPNGRFGLYNCKAPQPPK
jgi:hypothetical protein